MEWEVDPGPAIGAAGGPADQAKDAAVVAAGDLMYRVA